MPPASASLQLYQGDTFSNLVRLQKPDGTYFDLTGCSALAQIRNKSDKSLITTFNTPIGDQTDSTLKGGVYMYLTHAQTVNLPTGTNALMEYDLQITDAAGNITTYLKGDVTVIPEVSK